MKLSAHFTLEELLRSDTAARAGRDVEIDDPQIVVNLTMLCDQVLEPLRELTGAPIMLLSGYRPPWLNTLVGGSATSEHRYGRAADIIVAGMTPFAVCGLIVRSSLPFNQCIHEFGRWTHVSVAAVGEIPKREALTAKSVNGRTAYLPGIQALDTTPKLTYGR